jgi:hypothetical protein
VPGKRGPGHDHAAQAQSPRVGGDDPGLRPGAVGEPQVDPVADRDVGGVRHERVEGHDVGGGRREVGQRPVLDVEGEHL